MSVEEVVAHLMNAGQFDEARQVAKDLYLCIKRRSHHSEAWQIRLELTPDMEDEAVIRLIDAQVERAFRRWPERTHNRPTNTV